MIIRGEKMAKSAYLVASVVTGIFALAAPCSAQDTTTYTYDETGRVTTVTHPSGAKTGYQYDSAGNRATAVTALDGNVVMPGTPTQNHAPTCSSTTIVLTGLPSYATATVSVTSSQILALCSDADGDSMSVTSPTLPASQTIPPGTTQVSFPFTVSDGHGGTGVGSITYHRP